MFSKHRRLLMGIVAVSLVLANAGGVRANGDPKALAKAKLKAAEEAYRLHMVEFRMRPNDYLERCYLWSRRILEAQIEVSAEEKVKEKAVVAAYQLHANRMKTLANEIKRYAKSGSSGEAQLAAVDYFQVEAEHWVATRQVP